MVTILKTEILFKDGSNRTCHLIECSHCNTPSWHPEYSLKKSKRERNLVFFCSQECHKLFTKTPDVTCTNCNKVFHKPQSEVPKSGHNFCTKSCAATYNNKHKTYGLRRSKLENFIEKQIRSCYPNIECLFNNKEAVSSELDLYFPKLKLAIQINGPHHFKPIYGQEKLAKIQNLDEEKRQLCKTSGIVLYEIDVSTDRFEKHKDERWVEIKRIIDTHILL